MIDESGVLKIRGLKHFNKDGMNIGGFIKMN